MLQLYFICTQHIYSISGVTIQNNDYYIFPNAITRIVDDDATLKQSIESGDIVCGFSESNIYFDEKTFQLLTPNTTPDEVPYLNLYQNPFPIPHVLTNLMVEVYGTIYFYRLIFQLSQLKASQTHINDICTACKGILSSYFFGDANLAKSAIIQRALRFIGITSNTTSIYKSKDQTKAGIRRLMHRFPNCHLTLEDVHVAGNSDSYTFKELIFHVFSADQETLKSCTERGQSTQIVTQTSNELTFDQSDVISAGTMTRFIFLHWLNDDSIALDDVKERLCIEIDQLIDHYVLQFINCGNKLSGAVLKQNMRYTKAKHKQYAEAFDLEWYTKPRMGKFNGFLLTIGASILEGFFLGQTPQIQQWGQIYTNTIIKRSARFYRTFLDDPSIGNTNSTHSKSKYLVYFALLAKVIVVDQPIGSNKPATEAISIEVLPRLMIKVFVLGTSLSNLFTSLTILSQILNSDEHQEYIEYKEFINFIETKKDLKNILFDVLSSNLQTHSGNKTGRNVNNIMFTHSGNKKKFVLKYDKNSIDCIDKYRSIFNSIDEYYVKNVGKQIDGNSDIQKVNSIDNDSMVDTNLVVHEGDNDSMVDTDLVVHDGDDIDANISDVEMELPSITATETTLAIERNDCNNDTTNTGAANGGKAAIRDALELYKANHPFIFAISDDVVVLSGTKKVPDRWLKARVVNQRWQHSNKQYLVRFRSSKGWCPETGNVWKNEEDVELDAEEPPLKKRKL